MGRMFDPVETYEDENDDADEAGPSSAETEEQQRAREQREAEIERRSKAPEQGYRGLSKR